MQLPKEFDTITAISTPLGEGAIVSFAYLEPMQLLLLIRFSKEKI